MSDLARHLMDAMQGHGDTPLWLVPERITYRDALDRIRASRDALLRAGVRPGERVLLQRENDLAWPTEFLAILGAGAVAVPVDPHLTDGEVRHLRAHCGARWALAEGPIPIPDAVAAPPPPAGTAIMLYSSGTTGTPKAVPLTHANLLANVSSLRASIALGPSDRMLCLLPFHHAFALTVSLLAPIASGSALGLAPPLRPRELFAAWAALNPTFVATVPALLRILARAVGRGAPPPAGLRGVITGGAAAPAPVLELLATAGYPVLQGYGMTEASPVITTNVPGGNRIGSVGRPLPGVEVRISSPDGDAEILVRGPNVMGGYYRDPERTAETLRDGWLHTGDLGRIDRDGYLTICGRSKNLILSDDGKNIYPEEIEAALSGSPLFAEVSVVGRPAGDGRERVAAVVVAAEPLRAQGDPIVAPQVRQEVARLCATLAPYKRVQEVFLHPGPLPKTPTLKVRRADLLAWLADRQAI